MHKEFAYTVRGCWPFPLDMLRRDQSRAATPQDQEKIDRYSMEHAPDKDVFEPVEIDLVGPCRPLTARWESFMWAVPTDVGHAVAKRCQAEERERLAHLESGLAKLSPREREAIEWHFRKAV